MVLLFGTLIKNYKGRDTVSCGEAAKIYLDADIPEREDYLQRLAQQLPAIEWVDPEHDQYRRTFQQSKPDPIKIQYLLTTDPNEYLGKNMICTVTIMKVLPSPWWFLACVGCHKTAYTATDQFVCSDQDCRYVAANPRYRVRVIGVDCTGEAEFVFFARVAKQMIGKKVDALTRIAAHRPDTFPAEIAALVSQKCTLNVSVNQRGLRYRELSFQVNNIETIHPKSKSFEFGALGSSSKQQTNASSPVGLVQPLLALDKVGSENSAHASSAADDVHVQTNITDKAADEISDLASEMPPTTPASITKDKGAPTDNISSLPGELPMKRPMDSSKKSSVAKKLFK